MGTKNPPKAESYYQGLNQWLLRAVPEEARTILEVGCAEGRLGEALKQGRPDRRVCGLERERGPAHLAAGRLDQVLQHDVEAAPPDLPPASFDCILFGDVLEHLRDPLGAIRRLLPLLRPDGTVLCCVPNVQHVSVVSALLRGDFQYQPLGIMDETHVRFFTYASFTKLLLDAGLEPEIVDHVPSPPSPAFMEALGPALRHSGVDGALAQAYLGSYQYVFRGRRLGWELETPEAPMSFVVCVNDEAQLQDNLLASPSLRGSTIHEIITIREADSVGHALEAALRQAVHPLVVLVHQDVYLPAGWVQRFQAQWREAERRFGKVGLAGLYGARLDRSQPGSVARLGHVVDRYRLLRAGSGPVEVDTLDEVLLAMPGGTPLRISEGLGFHLYGSDLGCRARALGLPVVALDAPAFHNSLLGDGLPPAFHQSAARFKERWRSALPVATNCGLMEAPPDEVAAAQPPAVEPPGTAYHRWYYDTAVWDRTSWAGVKALKSPMDMWNYQEILAERRPALVVEFGTRFGGGALFFAAVLRQLGHRARVLTVDVDAATVDARVRADPDIELLVASSTSEEVARRIAALRLEYPGPVFAILDSDHSRDHVLGELRLLRPILVKGDYLVVEDSNLNGHPVLPSWGPGPWEALQAYLSDHPGDYVPDREREAKFGFTFATDGFLVRS
jgi:cephalosporin hydroxylase/SAM-dependent methyltransferase